MIMKPNPMNSMGNLVQSPKNQEIGSLNLPLLKSCASMQFPTEKVNNYPRHISPFLARPCESDGKTSGFVVPGYFKDDSDIRQVIEKIKRNENFETGLNHLTDFLEKHPGFIAFYHVFSCFVLKGFNLLPYFHECPQNFIDYITESIERIKQQRYISPAEKTLFENRNYSVNPRFF